MPRALPGATPGEYLPIRRRWSPGDVIQLKVEVVPQVIEANPRVADDTGRVAIQRGPLIYCLEEIDQPSGVSLSDVAVNPGRQPAEQFQTEFKGDLLGGMVLLHHTRRSLRTGTFREGALFSLQYGREDPEGPAHVHPLLRMGESASNLHAGLEPAATNLAEAENLPCETHKGQTLSRQGERQVDRALLHCYPFWRVQQLNLTGTLQVFVLTC